MSGWRKRQIMEKVMKEDYFQFLDTLRESGITNMFGATPYLIDEFGLSKSEARDILVSWMESFPRKENANVS
jgi:predicted aconitase